MLAGSIILGLLGLSLSAMFSGSEIAFYRIPKIRLKLDAMGRDRTARHLLELVNRPSLFVSTVLVGNNVANYLVSLSTVMIVGVLWPDAKGIAFEIFSTLLLAPFLFVYGEMFPKYICLRAPNRMLRLFSPILFFFFFLFIPVTFIIWLINQGISKLLGQRHEMLRLTLGRQELAKVLDEGRETGILFDTQRRLAEGVFDQSKTPVADLLDPANSFPRITTNMSPGTVLDIARKNRLMELPVYDHIPIPESDSGRQDVGADIPLGFVRIIDLELAVLNKANDRSKDLLRLLQTELPVRDVVEISSKHTLLTAMILLQTLHGTFGCVIDPKRRCLGFVRSDQLREVLLGTKPPASRGA